LVLSLLPAALGVVLTVALAVAAIASRALTPAAGAVAAGFGAVVVVLGGFPFLALFVLFVVSSVLATRYGFEEKRRLNLHEGTQGERGVSNVLAHAVLPASLVVVSAAFPSVLPASSLAVLYTAALAFGSADTFASEFGVLAGKARSILTLRPVPPGTNGGVSGIGEFWALVGALSMSVVGTALFVVFDAPVPHGGLIVAGAAIAGFAGCQVDSVLGETLENRGYLSKGSTNLLGMVSSVLVALVLIAAEGGPL
jgi:uncharacterized protein (TIGR00297 family)